MQRRHLLATLAAVSLAPGMSFAQEGKPLRMIVPFPPGGATDITARTLQDAMARILKQPVVLENRGGAGGSIGMAEVARAPADGLTIGVATLSTHGVNPAVYSKLPYHPTRDFVGVTEIVKAPGVIVVNPKALPVKDFADLVKYLKAGQRHHRPHVGRAVQEQHRHLDGAHPLPWRGPGHQRRAGGPGGGVL